MDDPISRQTAIDAIQKDRETSWKDLENDDVEYKSGCDDGYAYSMQIISELPSVEQRKKGKWIEVDNSNNTISGRCSLCGWEAHLYEDDVVGMNYCPNCGAKMEEDDE